MKFTKEQAFENLKGLLTNNGKKPLRMSEMSINKQLEALLPLLADDETELDTFVGKVKNTFTVMNSNAEKDNSDFVKKWEEEHPVKKEGNDKKDEKKDDKKDEVTDPALQAVLEKLSSLENEIAESKKKDKLTTKRKELEDAMIKKGIKDDAWRKDFLDEINISEDMDVEAKADSYARIYNKGKADEGDDDSTPFSSKGGNKNKHLFDDINNEVKRQREIEKNVM